MPELPEVEIVRTQLARALVGSKVVASRTLHPRFLKFPLGEVKKLRRHGKWLLFVMDNDDVVSANLGMSGGFSLTGPRPKHTLWELQIEREDKRRVIRYVDPRRMGRLRVMTGALARHISNVRAATTGAAAVSLGPDALCRVLAGGPSYRRTAMWKDALNTKIPIKRALMDQSRIAGLGNIYAAETCWYARVDPRRPACSLLPAELERVADSVPRLLKSAIYNGGTSLGDANSYRDVRSKEGANSFSLKVYGRTGSTCTRCRSTIESFKAGKRTTFFCPGCQR